MSWAGCKHRKIEGTRNTSSVKADTSNEGPAVKVATNLGKLFDSIPNMFGNKEKNAENRKLKLNRSHLYRGIALLGTGAPNNIHPGVVAVAKAFANSHMGAATP